MYSLTSFVGALRVISGKYKGLRFNPGSRFSMRPTTDRNRESLFNILSNRVELEGVRVLDLFAGSGGITYEFLSRGATEVWGVEKEKGLCQFMRSTLARIDQSKAEVYHEDVYDFLALPADESESFDIVFADPPYADPQLNKLPELIIRGGWLKKHGLLVVEHGKGFIWSDAIRPIEQRSYGESGFSFFTTE